jgi:hypothetical protein
MADKKITQLPSASIATSSDVLPIVQSGTTDQITVTNLGQGILNLGLDASFSNVEITGSVSITGSGFLNGEEILTSADTGSFYSTSSFGFYGAFCSTGSQTNLVANVSRSMVLETTELSDGVSIISGSRITISNAGVYNLQFSAQLEKTSNGTDTVYIWFKKNGSNVARSNTAIDVLKQAGSGGKQVAAWNYVDSYNVGDYVEIVWQSSDTTMQLLAATETGNLPAIPSIIATINQIS